jgi:ethanolamine utilization cobalamin adenosyltransferase
MEFIITHAKKDIQKLCNSSSGFPYRIFQDTILLPIPQESLTCLLLQHLETKVRDKKIKMDQLFTANSIFLFHSQGSAQLPDIFLYRFPNHGTNFIHWK